MLTFFIQRVEYKKKNIISKNFNLLILHKSYEFEVLLKKKNALGDQESNKKRLKLLQRSHNFEGPNYELTVGENIIPTTKIRFNYSAIQSFIFSILR